MNYDPCGFRCVKSKDKRRQLKSRRGRTAWEKALEEVLETHLIRKCFRPNCIRRTSQTSVARYPQESKGNRQRVAGLVRNCDT